MGRSQKPEAGDEKSEIRKKKSDARRQRQEGIKITFGVFAEDSVWLTEQEPTSARDAEIRSQNVIQTCSPGFLIGSSDLISSMKA